MSSKLTFSIEESLWLNRGQEISEVLAMSLEPNISIQEMEEHVIIKGGLLLHGEYRPMEQENMKDEIDEDVKLSSHRLAKEVTVSEDGIGEVKHFIPIDVTIPVNRIKNLDDIYVHIESFDYDLPERSCIQLTADITISGMSEINTESEQTYQEKNTYPSLDLEQFQFEARRPFAPEHDGGELSFADDEEEETLDVQTFSPGKQDEANRETNEIAAQENEPVDEEEQKPLLVREEVEQIQQEDDNQVAEPVAEQEDSLVVEAEEVQERVEEETMVEEAIDAQQEERSEVDLLVNIANERTEEEALVEQMKEEEELSESDDEIESEAVKYSSRTEENALYLTKMLQNGEERFTRLKMCIIQENESLSTIAERYNLSTSQLIRANHLEEETVSEGQILYIPASTSR